MRSGAKTFGKLTLWMHAVFSAPAMVRMAIACGNGRYRLARKVVLKFIAALAYIFFFIDLIPDFIPIAGWLDDLAVTAWMLSSLRKELFKLRNWERGE